MKEFIIPFYGLKPGIHEFDFKIGREFFEAFESTLIEDAELEVNLKMEKLSNMLILNFKAKGFTMVPCDRCGEDFRMPLKMKERFIVKFGDEPFEETDEIQVISHDTHEIDVSHRIYEMIVLNLPNKRTHKTESECDQEALKRLGYFEKRKEQNSDPRWDALNKLK